MTHLPEIWKCITKNLPRGKLVTIDDIYQLIENNLSLDEEDYEWQSPNSDIPKWKRNVRNVLQYRKNTKEIKWDNRGKYQLD
jgi:hypothetical protein